MSVQFTKLRDDAIVPVQVGNTNVFTITTTDDMPIHPLHMEDGGVGTGVSISVIEEGMCVRIMPLDDTISSRNGIKIENDIITKTDGTELRILFNNTGHDIYDVSKGDVIAQMIVEKIPEVEQEAAVVEETPAVEQEAVVVEETPAVAP
ncbi:hypothetical protein [Dishui Lake phycodnavirus 4]|nr:hypothetical protein [Dishui Lake phycodnavirus 4]